MRLKIEGILTLFLDDVDLEQVKHKSEEQNLTLEDGIKLELRDSCQRMRARIKGKTGVILTESTAIASARFEFEKHRPIHD